MGTSSRNEIHLAATGLVPTAVLSEISDEGTDHGEIRRIADRSSLPLARQQTCIAELFQVKREIRGGNRQFASQFTGRHPLRSRLDEPTENIEPRLLSQGGELMVRTEKQNGYAVIQISDTGKGIAKDQLQKIFDPFFTSKSEGTGMGLSVAHGIIQEHHGVIEVESEPRKGTTFYIYLPVLKEDAVA